MQVEGPVAGVLWVQFDLPRLAQGVRLNKMTFFVNVETVVNRMIFEIGDEPRYVYHGQPGVLLRWKPPISYCAGWPVGPAAPCRAVRSLGEAWDRGRPSALYDQWVTENALLVLLSRAADAVAEALDGASSRQLIEGSASQHHSDLATDAAAGAVLHGAGLVVLSEESGLSGPGAHQGVAAALARAGGLIVVLDPLDGSTNAASGLPWYATSLCVVDGAGPWVALVRNLATGEEFTAIRGRGATRNGVGFRSPPDRPRELAEALVLLSGHAPQHLGWRQYRTLGALALDLCAVATGQVDAYLDCSANAHGPWDYLGGMLVATEAGVAVEDVHARQLVVLDHGARRTPVAGPPELVAALVARWGQAVAPEPGLSEGRG